MGCGCGSSFSGKTQKRCSCGRNEGGLCQCNDRKLNAAGIDCLQDSDCLSMNRSRCDNGKCGGAIIYGGIYDYGAKQAQGGTTPSAERGEGKYLCADLIGRLYYSDKPCPNIYLDGVSSPRGGAKQVVATPSAQREVADPTGFSCEDVPCGRMRGGGRLRCPSGCKCKNNFCVSKNRRVAQGVSPKAKSRKDRMLNFHHSKSNFNARQVGFEDVKSRFNAFMGVTPQPQVDIKRYNIPQDEYYAYNDYYSGMGGAISGGFKTQWNKNNDLEVEF